MNMLSDRRFSTLDDSNDKPLATVFGDYFDSSKSGFGDLCKKVVWGFSFTLLLFSPSLQATEFELSRIATELNFASNQLAHKLKYSRSFGGVGQRADRLARESSQLVDAIRRNRSASYIRSQFNDVNRRYLDLEDSFLRAYRNNSDIYVFDQVGLISNLVSNLESTFYYTRYYVRQPQVFVFTPPVAVRNYDVPSVFYGGGRVNARSYNNGNQRQRYTVPRGNNLRNHENRVIEQRNRTAERHRESQRQIRQGRGSRTVETRRRNHYD